MLGMASYAQHAQHGLLERNKQDTSSSSAGGWVVQVRSVGSGGVCLLSQNDQGSQRTVEGN